ncbi:MAG: phosphotransferase [Patescibacteria group bacterium]|nr:phosphotransferase [Patescibacteria group bacterium]
MRNDLAINIHKIFPNLRWEKARLITSGWDYNVLLLDNNFVVRIPKNIEAKKRMLIDFCLLTYLQKKIDANLPVPILKDAKSKIIVYKIISGIAMSEARYKKLSFSQKNKFSKSLAVFLSQLHKIPAAAARHSHIPKKNIDIQNKEVAGNAKFIYSYLTQPEKKALDNFMEKRKKTLKGFRPTLIHGDLTSENIFINKGSNNNLGIIDFSDASIDDPARDFSALFSYGDQFVRRVLKYYGGTSKQRIFEHARIYYQETAIKLMALAIKGSKSISLKAAKKLFQQRLNIKRV